MNVKALLKEYFGTEESKRSRKLARLRASKLPDVKARIAGFLRGDESLQAFADGVRAAVEEQAPIDATAPPTPIWGFGGPGTSLFIAALLRAAPEAKIEAELRRALAGIDTRDPSDRLRTFAAFVARAAREANVGPDTNLHVGYATCFLSFCWHVLYDLEVPVFYGSSHRGAKALISGGVVADPEYASRDLAERFRAFLRITRGLQDLVRKVNPAFNFWTVESFLEWSAPRFEVMAVGSGSAMLSQVELGSLRSAGSSSSSIAAPPLGALGLMTPPPMVAPTAPVTADSASGASLRSLAAAAASGQPGAATAVATPPPGPPPMLDAAPPTAEAQAAPASRVTIGAAPAAETSFDDTQAAPRKGRAGAGVASGNLDMPAPAAPPPEDAGDADDAPRIETRKVAAKVHVEERPAEPPAPEAPSPAAPSPAAPPLEAPSPAAPSPAADAPLAQEIPDAAGVEEPTASGADASASLVSAAPGLTSTAMPLPDAGARSDPEGPAHEAEAPTAVRKGAPPSQTPTVDLSAAPTARASDARAPGALPEAATSVDLSAGASDVTARRIAFAPSATRRLSKPAPPEPTKEETYRALAKELRFAEKLLSDLDALLERRGQVALEGPTGTGKTLLARRFAAAFAGSPQRVRVVQLHPAFRYEDFVEGPHLGGSTGAGAGGAVSVGLMGGTHHAPQGGQHASNPGVLKAFALRAARDPKSRYVMVLDDLGRGDVISLLGEVFSLLEFREQEVFLPISREPFSLPKNLYFIATAQAATEGRGLTDPSLRRRFPFLALEPQTDSLRAFLEEKQPGMAWVADVFGELNKRLTKDAGPRAQLGQSIFMHATLDDAEVERIFLYDLRPMLEATLEASKLGRYELAALKKAVKA